MADSKITALPASTGAALNDLAAIVDDPSGVPVTQKATLQQIFDIDPWFKKVATAYVGGIQTVGQGDQAIDVQSATNGINEIASGEKAAVFGVHNIGSGDYCTAVGSYTDAQAYQASAVGSTSTASGLSSFAVGVGAIVQGDYAAGAGSNCFTPADYAAAIGYGARALITHTINFGGFNIIRKDANEPAGVTPWCYGGCECVVFSDEVDLEAVADQTVTLPAGCHFFPTEVGVVVTSLNALVTQPTVRFGWTGTPAGWIAAVVTTALTAAFTRERFTALLSFAGQTSMVAGVTSAASATTMLGRFYWKGILLEDE